MKGKGETTAILTLAIQKLTRQAYPRVSLDVVEALAVAHFVDALPEAQIRLRLREVGPSTLAEAKKIAEANITADKQRTRLEGKVEQNDQNNYYGHKIKLQSNKWKILAKELTCFQDLYTTLLNSKGLACLQMLVISLLQISTISQDQTDQITEICLITEIISPGEVIHISTNQIMVIFKLEEIKLDRRETFASQLRGPQPG